MPFTSNKNLSVQTAGSNAGTWGAGAATALNEGVIQILDNNLGGITSLSLSSSNVLLSQAQADNAMIRMTGTLLANVSVSPNSGVVMIGFYYWENLTSGSFTVTLSNGAGSVALPQGRRGIAWIDTTNGPRIVSIVGSGTADSLPTGTTVPFYQASVPAGWAASVSVNDAALRLVTNATTGGTSSGSVPFSTVFGYTTTGSHTLTLNEIPAHSHDVKYNQASDVQTTGGGNRVTAIISTGSVTASAAATPSGSGASHTHGMDMRVVYLNFVLGTRS